jgi:hypothetical protein
LRSLAHHPSLSALRSKSKSKVEKRKKKALDKAGYSELEEETSTPAAELRGLRGSRSVPRDLGSSDDDHGVYTSLHRGIKLISRIEI